MTDDATLPLGLLASLLFTLMGPIAVIPAFASVTAGADRALQRRIALAAGGVAIAALTIAVFVGASAMAKAGTSSSSLIIAAGLILILTAVRNMFAAAPGSSSGAAERPTPRLGHAVSPIAIPGMVTPVGIAVLIIFVSYFPTFADKVAIMAIASAIIVANIGAMLGAHWFMTRIGMTPLVILGSVFGVLQVAMGYEMLFSGLAHSRLFTMAQ
jgi:multiple antibiotic resistance protein